MKAASGKTTTAVNHWDYKALTGRTTFNQILEKAYQGRDSKVEAVGSVRYTTKVH